MVRLESIRRPKDMKRSRKRLGRGPGTGLGKTSGRGHKGQKSRSGGSTKPWFEGGQMPLQRRLPKRGFTPRNRVEYQVVNVGDLERLPGSDATPRTLNTAGLIGSRNRPVKILGKGELSRTLSVAAHAFSRTAREKIEKAGGEAKEIG